MLPWLSPNTWISTMTRLDHCAFENQLAGAKGVLRPSGRCGLLGQFTGLVDQAHAPTTAAGAGFDHQRVANTAGFADQGLFILAAPS